MTAKKEAAEKPAARKPAVKKPGPVKYRVLRPLVDTGGLRVEPGTVTTADRLMTDIDELLRRGAVKQEGRK